MDLSFVGTDDIFDELKKRFFAFTFCGEIRIDDDGVETTDSATYNTRFHGSYAHCIGLTRIVLEKELADTHDWNKD